MLAAQGRGLDPADLLKPLGNSWPTYSGDYTGKRYSSLKQINLNTVKSLTLAWTVRLTDGPGQGFGGGGGGGGASSSPARAKATGPSLRTARSKARRWW